MAVVSGRTLNRVARRFLTGTRKQREIGSQQAYSSWLHRYQSIFNEIRDDITAQQHSTLTLPPHDKDKCRKSMFIQKPEDMGPFTSVLTFDLPEDAQPIRTYRVMDNHGNIEDEAGPHKVELNLILRLYEQMVLLHQFDLHMKRANEEGLVSFSLGCHGEEATSIGSASALQDEDLVFAQYREHGVLLWRGATLENLMDTCIGNADDYNKGRQMPCHYGSRDFNYLTISSPLGTQTSQAVGAAYAYKRARKDACVMTYFGDGTASTGDVNVSLNFAATLETPVVFFCRSNQYAISSQTDEYLRSDGIAARARGFGVANIQVDGNDVFAVRQVTLQAREMALREQRPVLVEAITYRVDAHSSNVDCTDYRRFEDVQAWRERNNPIQRLKEHLVTYYNWDEQKDSEVMERISKGVTVAHQRSFSKKLPPLADLFTDVYHQMPPRLQSQQEASRAHVMAYPGEYPLEHDESV